MKATKPQRIVIAGDKVKYLGMPATVVSSSEDNTEAVVRIHNRDSRVSAKKPITVNTCELVIFR